MDRSKERFYRGLFLIAGVYDVVLGVIFTFFHESAFDLLGVSPPGSAYVPLIGAFLLVIGIAYFLIYRGDLMRNRDLIVVGTLYKLAYSTIALSYWAMGDLPHVAFASLFGIADVVFLVLMVECVMYLGKLARAPG